MKPTAKASVVLLLISGLLGLFRGYRMINDPAGENILFPYPKEVIKISVFSNFVAQGWVIFLLVGVFSVVTLLCIIRRAKVAPYLLIMEGIFITCLNILSIVVSSIGWIHIFFVGPVGLGMILLGVLLTPKEFADG
jgi:hypothetical protein